MVERIFDRELVGRHLDRARKIGRTDADFLLRRVVEDLQERVSVVDRRFEEAGVVDDRSGLVARAIGALDTVGKVTTVDLTVPAEGDASEILTGETGRFDLFVTALDLHLVNDTPGLMIQIRRLLKPDGLFLAAIPAAGTLQEMRESLVAAESEVMGGASPRVAPFGDVRDYGALLQRAGFALPVADIESVTVRYDTLFDLMFELRAMGMTNPLADRSRKPATRAFFTRAAEIYADRFSDPDGRIRATFAFVFLSGWAPHESQQKPMRPGSATARLADALKTTERKL